MIKVYDTGELRIDIRERLKGLEAPHLEMATFDCQTVVISSRGRELLCKTSPRECDEMAARMTELHVKWMGEDGPTDVLAFPMDELRLPQPGTHGDHSQPDPDAAEALLGDVVINNSTGGGVEGT